MKDLSAERQEAARRFAAALIERTKAELAYMLEGQPDDGPQNTVPQNDRPQNGRPQGGHIFREPAD